VICVARRINMSTRKNQKINFKYNLSIYLSLIRPYILLIIGILLISLVLESSYTAGKLFFKVIIDEGNRFTSGIVSRNEYVMLLLRITALFGSIIIGRSLLKWLHIHLLIQSSIRIIYDLKVRFFSHLLYLSHDFHSTHKSGSLISRLSRGGRAVDMMTDIIVFQFSPIIFQLITIGISIIVFDWIPALFILLTVISFISWSIFIQQRQQGANLEENAADDDEKGLISDTFTNIDSIKYYGREDSMNNRFKKAAYRTRMAMLHHWNFFRWWDLGHTLILGVGIIMVMLFPIRKFLDGQMEGGTLVYIFTCYASLISPMFMFVFGVRDFYRAMADFDSLFQYAKVENSIRDRQVTVPFSINRGLIHFQNVDFNYRENRLFSNFNLEIQPDEKVAFVGHSGCGKTTIVKLLYRFYDVNGGSIQIDGHDIRSVKQENLRSQMAIVPQDPVLFDDTIFNNILFSRPEATEEQVYDAMKFAQLDTIVERFPDRENTIVGERGVRLSGGEKQRVSIARAILADRQILVLDEATSALDSSTEYEIQRDLEKLLYGRTSIIIAHRLSTIMKADRVIVLNRGRIVQSGTHDQLVSLQGHYRKLWELQKNGYIA
jgi:ABC-type multidrug transport system fused ATPase/permease subunit